MDSTEVVMRQELIDLLREIRPNYSDVGSRDVDTRSRQDQIDRAIELLSASKPTMAIDEPATSGANGICKCRRLGDWDGYMHHPLCNESSAASPPTLSVDERETVPAWFAQFLTNVCELPDRNSPENEPEAIVATLEELRNCAINAIEEQFPRLSANQGAKPRQ